MCQSLELALKWHSNNVCYVIFIFGKANRRTARHVKAILKNNCNISRQLVNHHKFVVQLSKGVENKKKHAIVVINVGTYIAQHLTYLECRNICHKLAIFFKSYRQKLVVNQQDGELLSFHKQVNRCSSNRIQQVFIYLHCRV